jgi:hypothetical protein
VEVVEVAEVVEVVEPLAPKPVKTYAAPAPAAVLSAWLPFTPVAALLS